MKSVPRVQTILSLVLLSLGLAIPVQAQLPDYNQVCLGGPATENLSDTLSAYGLTASWTITANSLDCTFAGTPERATNWIRLSWSNTPASFPFACQITTTTGAAYDFEIQFDGAVNEIHSTSGLTADFGFGQYFPALGQLDVYMRPNQIGQTYDLTIHMSWGAGTPVAAATLGEIKALFR